MRKAIGSVMESNPWHSASDKKVFKTFIIPDTSKRVRLFLKYNIASVSNAHKSQFFQAPPN